LVLARFEGLSYKEIALQLGITVGAVESRLFRAMRTLEKKRTDWLEEGMPR
jgi:DNA-directed RNA polymerase specialized sigma24 family protein